MKISYSERLLSSIIEERSKLTAYSKITPGIQLSPISFEVAYQGILSNWNTGLLVGLGVVGVVGFIHFVIKMYTWVNRNHQKILTIELITRALLYLLDCVGTWYFWLIFAASAYWFIYYKGQASVTTVMLLNGDTTVLQGIFYFTFVAKALRIIDILWYQTHTDMFFIDWEKTRGKIAKSGTQDVAGPLEPLPVSIWRTLSVANEWNKLQSFRLISISFLLFAVIFFMRGINLEALGTSQPVSSLSGIDAAGLGGVVVSWVLRYFIVSVIWFGVALIQLFWYYGIHFRFLKDPIRNFVDLLSVSNISLFILSENCFGYYVHGRSVHANSDTNMAGLNINLKREEENLTGTRGLLPNSPAQSFEVYSTPELREQFDKIYLWLIQQDYDDRLKPADHVPFIKTLTKKIPTDKSLKAYLALNKFMTGIVDHTQAKFPYEVIQKSLLQRVTMLPPAEDLTLKQTVLMTDTSSRGFADVLFFGVEYDLFMFDFLLYQLVDILTANTFASVLITFAVDRIICAVRSFFGKENVSRKTLIDPRFLL